MHYPSSGTIVPKYSDSSSKPPNFKFSSQKKPTTPQAPKQALTAIFTDKRPPIPPDFKIVPRQKAPILAVTLHYTGNGKWDVCFLRRHLTPKTYHVSVGPAKLLTCLIHEFDLLNFVDISAELRGWTAFVDRTVYPPSKPELGVQDV